MRNKQNRILATRLGLAAVAMFAIGVFAMPTLYEKFCEITGLGQAGIRIAETAPATTASR